MDTNENGYEFKKKLSSVTNDSSTSQTNTNNNNNNNNNTPRNIRSSPSSVSNDVMKEWKLTSSNNPNSSQTRSLIAKPSEGKDSPRLGSRNMPLDGTPDIREDFLNDTSGVTSIQQKRTAKANSKLKVNNKHDEPLPLSLSSSSSKEAKAITTNTHSISAAAAAVGNDVNNQTSRFTSPPPSEFVDVKLGFPEEKYLVLINPGRYSIQYKVPRHAPGIFTSPYACPYNCLPIRHRVNVELEVKKMGPRAAKLMKGVGIQQTLSTIRDTIGRRFSGFGKLDNSQHESPPPPILKITASVGKSSLTHIHEFTLSENDLPAQVKIKFSTRSLFTVYHVSAIITRAPTEIVNIHHQLPSKAEESRLNDSRGMMLSTSPSEGPQQINDIETNSIAPKKENSIMLLDILELNHRLANATQSATASDGMLQPQGSYDSYVLQNAPASEITEEKGDSTEISTTDESQSEKTKEKDQIIEMISNPSMRFIKTFGAHFLEVRDLEAEDVEGRVVMLRGVNLAGNTKLPRGCNTQDVVDWSKYLDKANARDGISFVGRPFPLEDARDHFARISRWGFNCIRFIVTWEAIEHAGPGEYDVEYLDYVEQVIKIAGEYGLYVFIDPHQDVWCRATGGDGAPLWTLQAAGLDVRRLEECGAAFTHQSHKDPTQFPRMTWPQNYQRFACLHMFTLFWGGNDFAPEYHVGDGDNSVPIQEYLQSHFINSMMQVCMRVAKYPHVIGFDSFNEPSAGFICQSLDRIPETVIPPGLVFTPFDTMATAAGFPRKVRTANQFGGILGARLVNKSCVSCLLPEAGDIWKSCGVYDVVDNQPYLLKPDYFKRFPHSGVEVNFFRDFLRPFMVRYATKIRSVMPRAILFIEGDAFGEKDICWDRNFDGGQVVNATHWYDGFTLFTRSFNPHFSINTRTLEPLFGSRAIREMHFEDLKEIQNNPHGLDGRQTIMPTLIGEFGIPYDMNNKRAFKNGNYRNHELALSTYYDIFDELFLSSTQWNYSVENSNMFGDNWNLEDLSIYSPKNNYDKDGGRAIKGFSRPYPKFTCGAPAQLKFNFATKTFLYKYIPDPNNFLMEHLSPNFEHRDGNNGNNEQHLDAEKDENLWHSTVIFIPNIQYENKSFKIKVVRGTFELVPHDGYHHLHVWADVSAQPRQVLEAVEVYIHAKHD